MKKKDLQDLPAWCSGYTFSNQTETLHFFDTTDHHVHRTELYLPWAQQSYARESYAKAQAKDVEAREAREKAEADSKDDGSNDDESGSQPSSFKANSFTAPKKVDETDDLAVLKAKFESDLHTLNKDWVQVYDWKEPLKLKSASKYTERERFKQYWTRLKAGNFRKISRLDKRKLQAVVAELEMNFPIFEEVTKFIGIQMAMAVKKGKPPRFPALLLVGPPGIGKTHFTKALATATGLAYHEVSFSSEVKSSVLLGADKGWGNSMPGIVYESVMDDGGTANPLIVLDELDKSRSSSYDSYYQPPWASLHSLLEPITSVTTTDISVGLTFDASHVNWIATANDVSRIPASIQSRFKIFHVDLPTTAEVALQCAHTMINAVHKATALSGFVKPGKEVARIIAHLSPRGMRQTLEEAYAIASADGRLKLQGGDFPGLVLEEAGRKSGPVLH